MTANSNIVEITEHAVARYEKLVAADDRATADVRSEIRRLAASGLPMDPLWLPERERLSSESQRYVAIGQELALVLDRHATVGRRDTSVVLSVISCPAIFGSEA